MTKPSPSSTAQALPTTTRQSAAHLQRGDGPSNPFPGHASLERTIGYALPYRWGSNEGLSMQHSTLKQHLSPELLALLRLYPDPSALNLRQALATRLQLDVDNLIIDAGADSLILLTLRALMNPKDTVICSAGTYPTFAYFAEGIDCSIQEVPYFQCRSEAILSPDLQGLIAAAHQHQARLVYLANPDNPSGYSFNDAEIKRLREQLPDDCWLLLDEAYYEFRDDCDFNAPATIIPGVVRLRSFSKAYALAGLRIGYALIEPWVGAAMQKAKTHFAVSGMSLLAAETLVQNPQEVLEHINCVKQVKATLLSQFAQHGIEAYASQTNFIALPFTNPTQAYQRQQTLLKQGIQITQLKHPALAHLLRLTASLEVLEPAMLELLIEVFRT